MRLKKVVQDFSCIFLAAVQPTKAEAISGVAAVFLHKRNFNFPSSSRGDLEILLILSFGFATNTIPL